MNRATATVIVVMVALLTACTASPIPQPPNAPRSARSAPVEAPLVAGTCPRDGKGLVPPFESDDVYAGTAAPQGFEPATVVRCTVANGAQQQDGSMTYTVDDSTAALTPALAAALALPDIVDPPDANSACDAKAEPVLYLLLLNTEGEAYQPRTPISWCFAPRAEVIDAVAGISWEPRTSYEVKRTA